jgi:hypothetical protein
MFLTSNAMKKTMEFLSLLYIPYHVVCTCSVVGKLFVCRFLHVMKYPSTQVEGKNEHRYLNEEVIEESSLVNAIGHLS